LEDAGPNSVLSTFQQNLACDIFTVLDFIDFRKAFDSISGGKLFQILARYGIPETIITAIKWAYINTTAQVVTEDGNTDFFHIETGVLRGDTPAPYLFIIMVDYIRRTATKGTENLGLTITKRRSLRFSGISNGHRLRR